MFKMFCGALISTLLVLKLISCGGVSSNSTQKGGLMGSSTTTTAEKNTVQQPKLTVSSSVAKKNIIQGDIINITYTTSQQADSVKLFIGNKQVESTPADGKWSIQTDEKQRVGTINYRVTAYKDGEPYSSAGTMIIEPKYAPVNETLEVVSSFSHSRNAYTQGLEFYNGVLYESSGEYGVSYVHSLEFPSMKEVNKHQIDANLFAEGITFWDNKMYLLTWQEKKCLVLNPTDFSVIKEFSYNTEGWGLTTDGKMLYMSDGSQYIYIIDPETFVTKERLEVMVGNEPINYINEMEWIEGEIWANIYTTEQIVRIDPATGAVKGLIDASGLLRKGEYKKDTDVLNGIAYDRKNKKIYLTGKKWPKLFEVKIKR